MRKNLNKIIAQSLTLDRMMQMKTGEKIAIVNDKEVKVFELAWIQKHSFNGIRYAYTMIDELKQPPTQKARKG